MVSKPTLTVFYKRLIRWRDAMPSRRAKPLLGSPDGPWKFTHQPIRLACVCLNLDAGLPPLVDSGWARLRKARGATVLQGYWLSLYGNEAKAAIETEYPK
jgi:hypothetical protein